MNLLQEFLDTSPIHKRLYNLREPLKPKPSDESMSLLTVDMYYPLAFRPIFIRCLWAMSNEIGIPAIWLDCTTEDVKIYIQTEDSALSNKMVRLVTELSREAHEASLILVQLKVVYMPDVTKSFDVNDKIYVKNCKEHDLFGMSYLNDVPFFVVSYDRMPDSFKKIRHTRRKMMVRHSALGYEDIKDAVLTALNNKHAYYVPVGHRDLGKKNDKAAINFTSSEQTDEFKENQILIMRAVINDCLITRRNAGVSLSHGWLVTFDDNFDGKLPLPVPIEIAIRDLTPCGNFLDINDNDLREKTTGIIGHMISQQVVKIQDSDEVPLPNAITAVLMNKVMHDMIAHNSYLWRYPGDLVNFTDLLVKALEPVFTHNMTTEQIENDFSNGFVNPCVELEDAFKAAHAEYRTSKEHLEMYFTKPKPNALPVIETQTSNVQSTLDLSQIMNKRGAGKGAGKGARGR